MRVDRLVEFARKHRVAVCVLLHLVVAISIAIVVYSSGNYPQGNDVYGHWFKSNVLCDAIRKGTLLPTYTHLWYNGVDLFRYWPPLPYYALSILTMVAGGSIEIAYPMFVGAAYFVGAMGWLAFGKRENRVWLSFVVGALFFFLPDNMRVMFSEGNVPRVVITSMLPAFYFFVFDYVRHGKKKALVGVSALSMAIVCSHVMIAAMVGVATFLVLLLYGIANKQWKQQAVVLMCTLLSYIAMGVVLVPALTGGIVSQNSSASVATSSDWSQNLLVTLSPSAHASNFELFYFGLSIFFVSVVGLFIKARGAWPFFASSLAILICTSNSANRLISLLPLSQVFWMQRFVPIALTFFLIAMIYWKRCRISTMCVFLLLVAVDCVPTLGYLSTSFEAKTSECTLEKSSDFEDRYLLNEAKALTTNRLAFFDLSNTNSYPSYFLSKDVDSGVGYLFGWAYQGAKTEPEIVRINEALEYGFYGYALDRALEMGCDTIVVKRDEIGTQIGGSQFEKEVEFARVAREIGYQFVSKTSDAFLFRYALGENTKTFGTVTKYKGLAIGSSSHYIAYLYPEFKVGKSSCLDDYSLTELSKYDRVYLSNFSYVDKGSVEQKLRDLSEMGVRVYIDMDNVPVNNLTQKKEFLGVHAQFVTFTESFPVVEMASGSQFKLPMQTSSYGRWYCSYLTGLESNERYSTFPDTSGVSSLSYYGTSKNGRIHFVGFNLVYYLATSHNEKLVAFMDEVFGLSNGSTPSRQVVPITTMFSYEGVEIVSEVGDVNIGVANLDGFVSNRNVKEENHLVVVGEGTTKLRATYPHLFPGVIVSIVGWVLLVSLLQIAGKDETSPTTSFCNNNHLKE